MAALVDLDLNCRPPSPEAAAPEDPRRVMLCQDEQRFPDQMKDLHKFYGSFWKQSGEGPSNLHSSHELKLLKSGSRDNQNPDIFTISNKCKSLPYVAEQNFDVRNAIRRKPDAYQYVIDLEKPTTSGDVVETVGCSGFGHTAKQNASSQEGSCCISPEDSSLAESARLCRGWNSSRVSPGSVGSSETPDCQSPLKPSNTESRHSLIDLNVPQEESLIEFCAPSQEIYSPLVHSSSTIRGKLPKSSRDVFEKECGSSKGPSSEVMAPSAAAGSSRDVVAASSVQQEGLFDLNVSLESMDMPSETISNCGDKVVNNDGTKETASSHSFSKKNSLLAETSRKHQVVRNDHILASKDDNNVLLRTTKNNGMDKVQPLESGANSKDLIPETPLVANNVHPRPGVCDHGASNLWGTVSICQVEAENDDTSASLAARTLFSIFLHSSACAADCVLVNTDTAGKGGNDSPQHSLDSFENTVLNLEEIKDDGQSIPVIPLDMDGPACGIKLKRGRGMRNFQREIMPGLVSLARQEICDDLHAIGYEPKKTRSRKNCRGQGASSTRARSRKRGSAAWN